MKVYKPTTSSRRGMTGIDYSALTRGVKPLKILTRGRASRGGRSRSGRITVRFRGGGNKAKYRIVDFKQNKLNVPGRVEAIEYDPFRSAFIARIVFRDGERRYILAPQGIGVGDEIVSAEDAPLRVGSRLPLGKIPIGMDIHNIELVPGTGGSMVRSAGTAAQVLAQKGTVTHVALPSSEIIKIDSSAFASLGSVSNPEHSLVTLGKAGRVRWKGRRPHVRGSAMNPRDHPHGGGEGRAPIGMKHPKTPWGKPARGVKTRKRHKISDKYIVQRRRKKR